MTSHVLAFADLDRDNEKPNWFGRLLYHADKRPPFEISITSRDKGRVSSLSSHTDIETAVHAWRNLVNAGPQIMKDAPC